MKGPAELIASILDSGDLYVESEITVWHAFQEFFDSFSDSLNTQTLKKQQTWLNGNPNTKVEQVHQMMSNLRMHLLSPQFIRDQVLSFEPVAGNLLCRNLIDDAILSHC